MSRLKILLVVQWFTPEPIHVPLSIARQLREEGHEVEVLTGIPNYPHGIVADGFRGWRPTAGTVDGVPVHRTPLYPSHDRSPLRRALNYTSWAFSSTALGARALRDADVALVYSSPATAATAPMLWRRLVGTPYVLLVQDLWPDSVVSSSFIERPTVARSAASLLDRFVSRTYRHAAHVVVISPGMIDVLVARGVPREKISLVYNWAPDEHAQPVPPGRQRSRSVLGIDDEALVVAYAGNQGVAQGLDTVIRTATRLRHERSIRFVLAGDGTEADALERQMADAGLDNVQFLGQLDGTGMAELRSAADVQLVSLIDDRLFAVTMPSKIQSILASGQPLIVMAPGDAGAVVREARAGWHVPPGDAAALADAVLAARACTSADLQAMSRSGRDYYRQHMSRTIGGARLGRILADAAVPAPQRDEGRTA